jgi:Ca2+-binding EF-hand superfamily protein
MGNGASSDGLSKPLAITALARQLQFSKDQVMTMRGSFVRLASPDETISRDNFRIALQQAKITREQDLEIFDLLFTMWDSEGADKVQCKEFLMGISPLACPDETPYSILRFALQVSDEEKTGLVGSDELEDMLLSKFVGGLFRDALGSPSYHSVAISNLSTRH